MTPARKTGGLEAGLSLLAECGLNLAAHLRTRDCLAVAPDLASDLDGFPGLLLLGSAGPQLWESLSQAGYLQSPDPVDSYCRDTVRNFRDDLSQQQGPKTLLAWPNPAGKHVAVTRLGELAGWSSRSPLGLGIHARHGLWFAYRAVILLSTEADEAPRPAAASPCLTCLDKPCISDCPVGAVGGPDGLVILSCFDEREREGARCRDRCISRLSCPVGPESRYSLAQIAHHHRHARLPKGWRTMGAATPTEWSEGTKGS